jgi:hypothetical protein
MVKDLWRPAVMRYFIEVIQSDGTSIQPVQTVGEVRRWLRTRRAGQASRDTVNFETWQGNTPQLLPQWLNVNHDQAQTSLVELKSLGDVLLLPGHGDPWSGELSDALY